MKERINSTWLPSNQPIKEIKFRLAKRNPDKIFGDPAHVEITSQDIALLADILDFYHLYCVVILKKKDNILHGIQVVDIYYV